jgi:hypothetical protein
LFFIGVNVVINFHEKGHKSQFSESSIVIVSVFNILRMKEKRSQSDKLKRAAASWFMSHAAHSSDIMSYIFLKFNGDKTIGDI